MPKSSHDEGFSSEENAGGPENAVQCGLSGSVDVVKVPLGDGVVHGDDGIAKVASCGHGSEPVNARGGLLSPTDDAFSVFGLFTVNANDEVGAVVQG